MWLGGEEPVSFEDRNFFREFVNQLYLKTIFWPRKTLDKGNTISCPETRWHFLFFSVLSPSQGT